MNHRCKLARENAGLSIGQAARLLGITREEMERIEDPARQFVERAQDLADIYGVNINWLTGHADRYDYEAVKRMAGAEGLSFHDRDVLAELLASRSKP